MRKAVAAEAAAIPAKARLHPEVAEPGVHPLERPAADPKAVAKRVRCR